MTEQKKIKESLKLLLQSALFNNKLKKIVDITMLKFKKKLKNKNRKILKISKKESNY